MPAARMSRTVWCVADDDRGPVPARVVAAVTRRRDAVERETAEDARLVGPPEQLVVGPAQPLVGDDAVGDQEEAEHDDVAPTNASPQVSGVPGGRRLPT